MTRFRMGSLNHVHLNVPDRAEAARWYSEVLGFDPVSEYDFWATGIEGGPLQMSADGGRTMIALFEASDGHEMNSRGAEAAFSVDAATFGAFARSLPDRRIASRSGAPLAANDVIDFDLCWAYDLTDPWGHVHELNCFDYEVVRRELILAEGITPVRYWAAQ
jgi:catechol 2,3-dioxygenase-like lactoylglutathione lyase family enzyme